MAGFRSPQMGLSCAALVASTLASARGDAEEARWTARPSGVAVALRDVWAASPDLVFAVGEKGTILRSTDRGVSWVSLPSGTDERLTAVWGASADEVYVVSLDSIFRTLDRGASWKSVYRAATGGAGDVWGSGRGVFANVGTLLRSRDRGATWTELQVLPGVGATTVWASGSDVWLGADTNALQCSRNAGATFALVADVEPQVFEQQWVFGASPFVVYVTGSGTLARSTDGGAHWMVDGTLNEGAVDGWVPRHGGGPGWAEGDDAFVAVLSLPIILHKPAKAPVRLEGTVTREHPLPLGAPRRATVWVGDMGWREEPVAVGDAQLWAIGGSGADVYAVGEHGVIVKRTP